MRQAQIENGAVVNVIMATPAQVIPLPGTWVDVSALPDVGIGWGYDAGDFYPPPAPPPVFKKLLTAEEWVDTFTPGEWRKIKKAGAGTLAGVDDSDSEKIDQVLDSVRMTGGFDLNRAKATRFYNALRGAGIINNARKAELLAGVQV